MRNMIPAAVFLDLDDTLIDFSGNADETWQLICEEYSCHLEGVSSHHLLTSINLYRYWFWEDPERHRRARQDMLAARTEIVNAVLLELGFDSPALAHEIAQAFNTARETQFCLFPESLSTLQALRDLGIKLALLTNGGAASQRPKIERFELARYFDCIMVEGEFGVGKPDERVFLHALDAVQARPEETWMVGDNLTWDVAGSQKVGITGVWYDYARTGLPESSAVVPDRIITSLGELLRFEQAQ